MLAMIFQVRNIHDTLICYTIFDKIAYELVYKLNYLFQEFP